MSIPEWDWTFSSGRDGFNIVCSILGWDWPSSFSSGRDGFVVQGEEDWIRRNILLWSDFCSRKDGFIYSLVLSQDEIEPRAPAPVPGEMGFIIKFCSIPGWDWTSSSGWEGIHNKVLFYLRMRLKPSALAPGEMGLLT